MQPKLHLGIKAVPSKVVGVMLCNRRQAWLYEAVKQVRHAV